MSRTVQCNCGTRIGVPLSEHQQCVRCSNCGSLMNVPGQPAKAPALLMVPCGCGQQLRVSETSRGRKVQCPACKHMLVVPGEAPMPPADDEIWDDLPPKDTYRHGKPMPKADPVPEVPPQPQFVNPKDTSEAIPKKKRKRAAENHLVLVRLAWQLPVMGITAWLIASVAARVGGPQFAPIGVAGWFAFVGTVGLGFFLSVVTLIMASQTRGYLIHGICGLLFNSVSAALIYMSLFNITIGTPPSQWIGEPQPDASAVVFHHRGIM